jgi:hypothetical protein
MLSRLDVNAAREARGMKRKENIFNFKRKAKDMNEITYTDLQELTGQESGAVQYADGEILICNWTQVNGVPRMFATGLIGLGETLTAISCNVPDKVIQAMNEHEREQGNEASTEGFTAWLVNDEITIVTQNEWA